MMGIEGLASHFLELEGLCSRPKDSKTCETQLRKVESVIHQGLSEKSPLQVRKVLEDLQVRVETWRQVWPRLGQDHQFRNAVAREAHAWAGKLLKLSGHTSKS